jgi:DNA-binding XRE family transcriptional regulator
MTPPPVSTQNARTFANLLLVVSVSPTEIGQRIKAARQRKDWTQLEFALEAGVSPATIQRWEAGKLPRVRELMRVAELLGISTEEGHRETG